MALASHDGHALCLPGVVCTNHKARLMVWRVLLGLDADVPRRRVLGQALSALAAEKMHRKALA